MKFAKTLLAAALFASTGAANAMTSGTNGTADELFLQVWDQNYVNPDNTKGRTYSLDLGVSFSAVSTNAGTALAAFTGAGKNLATDANWVAFSTGMSTTGVQYYLADSDNSRSILVTGNSPIQPNTNTTVLLNQPSAKIASHGAEIAVGMGVNSSLLIKDQPDNATGQFDIASTGQTAGTDLFGTWTGYNATATYGSTTNFYLAGWHYISTTSSRGITSNVPNFTASDVLNLGTFSLSGNTLSFAAPAPAAVPLPAAVWMFGAGLMGFLGMTRRKSVEV